MGAGKDLLKNIIVKTCSLELQKKLRGYFIARSIVNGRCQEEPEMDVLKSLLKPGDVVADIGANVGEYTWLLATIVGSGGCVYSFEPISDNYRILTDVVNKGCLSNVKTFRMALAAQAATCEMVIPPSTGFTGYYLAHLAKEGDAGPREMVDVLTLDGVWKKHGMPRLDFIKCDVEGAELEVIRGGREIIATHLPGWLLEVSPRASGEVFLLLREYGYQAFVFKGKLMHTDTYRSGEFLNYFFFHPGSKMWRRIGGDLWPR